ncbi:MAG: hypothetical protein HY329_00545 [Chloroflexi bacterium]|nr:hypothetical protein [Chloroflexota bacterium]
MTVTDTTNVPAPTLIPVPPDFAVSWEPPDDARLFWTMDRVHCPEPLTPLSHDFVRFVYQDGISGAAQALEFPIRCRTRDVNTYFYMTLFPVTPPEEMEAQGRRAEDKLRAAMARLSDLWQDEWLPEIKEHVAFWERFDLRAASTAELLVHLDESIARTKRLWELHFHIVFPSFTAQSLFEELYHELFPADSALAAYRLTQGIDNTTLRANRALWELTRRALASPWVRQVLYACSVGEVETELRRSPEGQAFLAELRAYRDEYGQRTDQVFELSARRWIEDPIPVISTLKDYLTQPDRDLAAELAELAAERERLVSEVRERLRSYPQAVVGKFDFFLKAAQEATVVREEHNFWIDFRSTYLFRQVVLEFGRRLAAAGAVDQPDDVFYLTLEELRATVTELPHGDRRRIVAERRAKLDRFRAITPPPALGTVPPGPPPDDPVGRAIGKVLGVPPPPMSEPSVLRGVPASHGRVRATARVIRTLDEADRLRAGDVLVAESTLPPWTPLFATAAAVVTDTGGVLSHAAIVAREYRIPAVVGTGFATALLRDGQTIEVDGDAGVVRILPSV